MRVAAKNRLAAAFGAWTGDRPAGAGYFWLRFPGGEEPEVVSVAEDRVVFHFHGCDEDGPIPLDSDLYDDALWSGPLGAP